jgi:cation:H+ antiporter
MFGVGALSTLGAGVVLAVSGEAIAKSIGLTDAVFAATVLAAATALPEVATGLRSVRNANYEFVSDIYGGNAFIPAIHQLRAQPIHSIRSRTYCPLGTST